MKLLEATKELSINDLSLVNKIHDAIESRLFWLEEREPEYDGMVYETWAEKYEEWQDIFDISTELNSDNEKSQEKIIELIEDLQTQVENFQIVYGGLSKLRIG